MAYDPDLANRLRSLLAGEKNVTEMSMFGGLAFLINGNMAVSASGRGGLLLRVNPDDTDELTADAHATRFAMGGRPMDGWLNVDVGGLATEEGLQRWVAIGVAYAQSLPPKKKAAGKR